MRLTILFAACLSGIFPLQAEVKMPAIFGDHMVLQQEIKVPVWGTTDPGEKVTVIVGDHTPRRCGRNATVRSTPSTSPKFWDRPQNILWRVDNGEIEGLHPKLIVLMVSSHDNNGTSPTDAETR